MRSISLRRAGLVLGAILPFVTGSALADVLVLRATGPSAARFAPGKSIPDSTRITLTGTDQLVVLDSHGTRTLQGPGSFVAGSSTSVATVGLGSLASARTERRARIGAVRGGLFGAPQRPNIFFVDVGASGAACVPDAKAVTLWRAASEAEGSSTVSGPSGATASLSWIKGEATQPWPAAVPIQEGATYRITGAGAPAAGTTLHFVMVPVAADLTRLAGALVAHGCQGQLDMLIAATTIKAP